MSIARIPRRPAILETAAVLLLGTALGCDAGDRAARTAGGIADDIAGDIATLAAAAPAAVAATAAAVPTPDEAPADDAASDDTSDDDDTDAAVSDIISTLEALPVAPRGSGVDYDRGDWRHWTDADGDCQNTRAETLIAESRAPVAFAPRDDNDRCRVIRGRWLGPWSGEVFTDAGEVDIDHHVPLGHAHEAGGWQWSADRKRGYANDLSVPASLQAIQASLNRAKGKQAPDQWRPPNRAGWCRYAADWIAVKDYWELTVTDAEAAILREMLDSCDEADSWGLDGAAAE